MGENGHLQIAKPRIDLNECTTICDAFRSIEDGHQQIADAEQAEPRIDPEQSDEAEQVDPMIDLEDCMRLRYEIFPGYCVRPTVILILEFLNLFIGSVLAYEDDDTVYSEVLIFVTSVMLLSLLSFEMLPYTPLDLYATLFYEEDVEYVKAFQIANLAAGGMMFKSLLFCFLTVVCIFEENWVALAWAYKDPISGLLQFMSPLYLQCYPLYMMYLYLKHRLQRDGKVFFLTQMTSLQRHAYLVMDILGRARALSFRVSSIEKMEGFEFPKGVGVDTIFLAPDLIPADECSLATWFYLKRYLFVKFSNYLGCDYERIESDYKMKKKEDKNSKDYMSTYNVASRWCA